MHAIKKILQAFIDLFFLKRCIGCHTILWENERLICWQCHQKLPFIIHNKIAQEKVAGIFKGVVLINYAKAIFTFSKETAMQKILHHLKYHNQQDIGPFMAEYFLSCNENIRDLKQFDAIVPIPLSKNKRRQRGYNQLDGFGKYLAEVLQIPYENTLLSCRNAKKSQTQKTQWQRFENVSKYFFVGKNTPDKIPYKKILLIDDVLTTGATSIGCAKLLQEKWDVEMGFLVMAANV